MYCLNMMKMKGLMILLVCAPSAYALVGPPPTLASRTGEVDFEVGRATRDVQFEGTVGASTIAKTKINIAQTSYVFRGAYAISENLSPYLLLGLGSLDAGNIGLAAGGISQGTLGMKGEAGLLWGVGINYVFSPMAAAPDIRVGVSTDYRHSTSSITGGEIELDDFRIALKGSRNFDRVTPYAGILYSHLGADFKGVTDASQAAAGTMESDDNFGVLVGAGYDFSEKVSGRIEAEFVSSFAINASLIYNIGGPVVRRAPPQLPAPVRATEVATRAAATRRVKPAERPVETEPYGGERPRTSTAGGAREREERAVREQRDGATAEQQIKLGNDLTAIGRYDEAIIFYRRAVTADPWNVRGWYNLATAQYLNRDYAGAKESFEGAIKINPSDVESHLFLGFSYYRMGLLENAARSWRRVLELDPSNSVALNNLQALGR